MKLCSTLFIGLACSFTFSQTTLIPDAAFEQYLIDIGADSGMPDGSVPTAQIAGITGLYMINKGISDLTGIEDFSALEYLEFDLNAVTTLDVSQNSNLQFLFCTYNLLTSLNVSGCSYLYSLDCDNNNLTNLDVSMNPTLTYLNCGRNELTVLDVSNNDLVWLGCYQNDLTALDVSTHPDLEMLQCEDNQLTSLDLSDNQALEFLNAGSNLLTGLDISSNPLVNEFYCSNSNTLECLNVRNGNNINFVHFEALNNPLLSCIEVDDSVWASDLWSTYADAGTTFSNLCSNPCSSNQLGLRKNAPQTTFEIYPNPASNAVKLEWGAALSEDSYFELLDIQGRIIDQNFIPAGTATIEFQLQNPEPGIYYVKWIQAGATATTRCLIVE